MPKEKWNYYKNEVDRMPEPEDSMYSLTISNGEGHQTNWMNINKDQLMKIREILGERE